MVHQVLLPASYRRGSLGIAPDPSHELFISLCSPECPSSHICTDSPQSCTCLQSSCLPFNVIISYHSTEVPSHLAHLQSRIVFIATVDALRQDSVLCSFEHELFFAPGTVVQINFSLRSPERFTFSPYLFWKWSSFPDLTQPPSRGTTWNHVGSFLNNAGPSCLRLPASSRWLHSWG